MLVLSAFIGKLIHAMLTLRLDVGKRQSFGPEGALCSEGVSRKQQLNALVLELVEFHNQELQGLRGEGG